MSSFSIQVILDSALVYVLIAVFASVVLGIVIKPSRDDS
jgi:hypothetical protein